MGDSGFWTNGLFWILDTDSSDSSVIVPRIEVCLHDIATWISLNKLKLNGDKTELLVIGSHATSSSVSVPLFHCG